MPFTCFFLEVAASDLLERPQSPAWLMIARWAFGVIYVGIGLYLLRRTARLLYGITSLRCRACSPTARRR